MDELIYGVTSKEYSDMEDVLMSVKRAYKDPNLKELLKQRKEIVKRENKGITPCINIEYWCETCGSHSHKCHPENSRCFICDTDNWLIEKAYEEFLIKK